MLCTFPLCASFSSSGGAVNTSHLKQKDTTSRFHPVFNIYLGHSVKLKRVDSEELICHLSYRYSILENGFLHIESAHVTDTGRYLCMATNVAGTDRRRIDLQVHGKYTFIKKKIQASGPLFQLKLVS